VGTNNNNGPSSILRPYVEGAISGIQTFLESHASQLRSDDMLNLFETTGLLLGKTGLSPQEQQQYLTQVMAPHVRSIELALVEKVKAIEKDPYMFGETLANSIAAIAYLSKGFKQPPAQVQELLLQTMQVSMAVLEALPGNDQVRNKTVILTQRLIQCLEAQTLPFMPRLLSLLISHCNTEDILDVCQLMNQLCIKFKSNAAAAIDGSLLPFLQKCTYLSQSIVSNSSAPTTQNDIMAPHLLTEKLSVQKLSYSVLQHVVVHRATATLLSPTNVSSLEYILETMGEGAIFVEDPVMKKSCLVFFGELLDQWIKGSNGTCKEATTEVPPDDIVHGFIRYFCDILVPGMLQAFLAKDNRFNPDDASNFRCIGEFSGMLEIVKNHLPDVYHQQIMASKIAVHASTSKSLMEAFCLASSKKDFETCFKALIENK
jgi:exportin-T